MIVVGEKILYKAFGLNIKSDIKLPELSFLNEQNESIDVNIQIKDLSEEWKAFVLDDETYKVKENMVLFKIQDTGIFYIKGGREIYISPVVGADEDKIRLFLLGTCMGAILIQRKIIPLHGSAIEINGKAYAIIGDSGAGKSTLASAFINQGYKLLSDDVIPISFQLDETPIVTPSYPQQKLWEQSLKEFGMDQVNYRPIIERENKFAIPVASSFYRESIPLAGIFELSKTEKKEIVLRKIEGIERLQTLFTHTYRNFLIELLDLMEWHFAKSSKIIKQIGIYKLQRPVSSFTANHLVSLILETIQGEC